MQHAIGSSLKAKSNYGVIATLRNQFVCFSPFAQHQHPGLRM